MTTEESNEREKLCKKNDNIDGDSVVKKTMKIRIFKFSTSLAY